MIDYEYIYNKILEPRIMNKDGQHEYPKDMQPKEKSMLLFLYSLLRKDGIPKVFIKDDCEWVSEFLDIFLFDKTNSEFTVAELFDYLESNIQFH